MRNCKTILTGLLCLGLASATSHAVIIDMTTVGDAGNPNDVAHGINPAAGAVSYTYNISKYEVTNTQYVEFLNAVDSTGANPDLGLGTDDTIYNANMTSNARGGIDLVGGNPIGSKYVVKSNMGYKPVNYVSFFDAMRFVNWLENGQGSGGTESGVYTITATGLSETRSGSASFWLPSEDEWYKAAYYDPTSAPGDNYWLYPTESDSFPTVATANAPGDISNPGANVANYFSGADWNSLNGNVTTVGSAGASSASYYGTFDQGGNVWEWNEAIIGSSRGLRGGSWYNLVSYLRASDRYSSVPSLEINNVGFRVAGLFSELSVVPEPSTVFLLLTGGLLCWRWARKAR